MTKPLMTNPVDKVRRGWGDAAPAWVKAMGEECQTSSQARVAKQMGYSAATISLVLGCTYSGDLSGVEEAFKSAFEGALVTCPALGGITAQVCRDWRKRAQHFVPSSTRSGLMFRACNACARNQKEATE